MDLNTMINLVEIAAISYIGFILKTQIKSQNILIQNMKQYSDMIDINKLKAYTASMIKLAETEAKLDAIKYIKEELSTGRYDEKLKSIDKEHCDEFLSFSLFAYRNSNAEMRSQIKSKFFQKSGQVLDKIALSPDNELLCQYQRQQ